MQLSLRSRIECSGLLGKLPKESHWEVLRSGFHVHWLVAGPDPASTNNSQYIYWWSTSPGPNWPPAPTFMPACGCCSTAQPSQPPIPNLGRCCGTVGVTQKICTRTIPSSGFHSHQQVLQFNLGYLVPRPDSWAHTSRCFSLVRNTPKKLPPGHFPDLILIHTEKSKYFFSS